MRPETAVAQPADSAFNKFALLSTTCRDAFRGTLDMTKRRGLPATFLQIAWLFSFDVSCTLRLHPHLQTTFPGGRDAAPEALLAQPDTLDDQGESDASVTFWARHYSAATVNLAMP